MALPPLLDETRVALLRIALLLCVSTGSLLPLTARSSLEVQAQPSSTAQVLGMPAVPGRLEFPAFDLARDPFVPDASEVHVIAESSPVPGAVPAKTDAVIRAIVLGPRVRALVESGGSVNVLEVGDRIGGIPISSIDRSGVQLENGRRIGIEVSKP